LDKLIPLIGGNLLKSFDESIHAKIPMKEIPSQKEWLKTKTNYDSVSE